MQYKVIMNSTEGRIGQIIERDPTLQSTKELLERGLIIELKIEQPAEVKKRASKSAK